MRSISGFVVFWCVSLAVIASLRLELCSVAAINGKHTELQYHEHDYTRKYFGFDAGNPARADCIPYQTDLAKHYQYHGKRNFDAFGRRCQNWLTSVRSLQEGASKGVTTLPKEIWTRRNFSNAYCRSWGPSDTEQRPYCYPKQLYAKDVVNSDTKKSACIPDCLTFESITLNEIVEDKPKDVDPSYRNRTVSGQACLPWRAIADFISGSKATRFQIEEKPDPVWNGIDLFSTGEVKWEFEDTAPPYDSCRGPPSIHPINATSWKLGPFCYIEVPEVNGDQSTIEYEHCYQRDVDFELDKRGCFSQMDKDNYRPGKFYRGTRCTSITGTACLQWRIADNELEAQFGKLDTCQCIKRPNDWPGQWPEDCEQGLWCFTNLSSSDKHHWEWEPCYSSCDSKEVDEKNCFRNQSGPILQQKYRGMQTFTFSGRICKFWNETGNAAYIDPVRSKGIYSTNLCRSILLPGEDAMQSERTMPWCWTQGPDNEEPEPCFMNQTCEELENAADNPVPCLSAGTRQLAPSEFWSRMTVDRKPCKAWADADLEPIFADFDEKEAIINASRAMLVENFCRNPDNWTQGPWCVPMETGDRLQPALRQRCLFACPNYGKSIYVEEPRCQLNGDVMSWYIGRRERTMTSLPCVNWSEAVAASNNPLSVRVPESVMKLFALLRNNINVAEHLWYDKFEHNFCRNLDADPRGPWCMAMDETTNVLRKMSCFERCEYLDLQCFRNMEDRLSSDYQGSRNYTVNGRYCVNGTTCRIIAAEKDAMSDETRILMEMNRRGPWCEAKFNGGTVNESCFKFCEDYLGFEAEYVNRRKTQHLIESFRRGSVSPNEFEPGIISHEELHATDIAMEKARKEREKIKDVDENKEDPRIAIANWVTAIAWACGVIFLLFTCCCVQWLYKLEACCLLIAVCCAKKFASSPNDSVYYKYCRYFKKRNFQVPLSYEEFAATKNRLYPNDSEEKLLKKMVTIRMQD